jgi:glycylpeptide N-tetradecanoyltransferase
VEDEDHTFRFDYSRDFLKWHLTAPGSLQSWLAAVIKETDKTFVGFISAIPVHVSVNPLFT